MRYLKTYKIFESEDKLDYDKSDKNSVKLATDSLNSLIEDIREFNSKKSNLEKLIMNNRGEDSKDISKNIEDIIEGKNGRNKFLSMYVSIVNKLRSVENLKDKIEYFKKLKSERKSDLIESKKLSNISDRKDQEDKLKNQLSDIDEKVKEMSNKISDLEKEISDNKKDLDKNIKESEKKFKDNLKNTEWKL